MIKDEKNIFNILEYIRREVLMMAEFNATKCTRVFSFIEKPNFEITISIVEKRKKEKNSEMIESMNLEARERTPGESGIKF
jgi:hypothetical protein